MNMPHVTTEDRFFSSAWPNLDAILDEIWDRLESASERAGTHWHLPILGTASETGPQLRTVVLRHADRESRLIGCHTDARSGKVAEIKRDPNVSWLFYDHDHRVQLSMQATATVHHSDDLADRCWSATPITSRRCYLAPCSPGELSSDPTVNLPDHLQGGLPTEDESEAGRPHFSVVTTVIQSIDWLYLNKNGNRRARFEYEGDSWSKMYVEP